MAYVNTFSSSAQGILHSLSPELKEIFATKNSFPKCVMIGTCKDKVDSISSDVLDKLRQLDTLVNRCTLSDRLICPDKMKSIAFEINNTVSGSRQECLDPGMLELRRCIVEFTQEMAVKIPSLWLSFKINLEKLSLSKYKSGIIPFEDVKAVAVDVGINPEAALVYFHELGIFLWYHYSHNESLKRFVIIDPKKLLEVLASIFNPGGYSQYRSQWNVLKERGLLQMELYKHLVKQSKTGLPESWILEFLVEHHLAIRQDENYFIPSMLKTVTEFPEVSPDQQAAAIFIIPDSKYTSPGLFPRLVTVLAGVKKGITQWRLPSPERKDSLCRNQVEFCVNGVFRVVLTEFIEGIRVICHPIIANAAIENDFCVNVLSTLKVQLQRSIPQSLDKLTFPFTFTFECKCASGSKRHFLPSLPWRSDEEVLCTAEEAMKLEDRHKIWLREKPLDKREKVQGEIAIAVYGLTPEVFMFLYNIRDRILEKVQPGL